MPVSLHRVPPQTSKKARKAYLKANKHFEFTPTQARASERRQELDKRAKALQAKEQRKKDKKRKREEKEASEREVKRKRVQSSEAPITSLWGKVRASQPRLNNFFSRPKAADKQEGYQPESEDEASSAYDYDLQEEVGDDSVERSAQDSAPDIEGLEAFFSSPASKTSTDMAQASNTATLEVSTQMKIGKLVAQAHNKSSKSPTQYGDHEQVLLDAQLSLSEEVFGFDIAEDDDAEWMPLDIQDINHPNTTQEPNIRSHLLATPSKRKAENAGTDLASPAKSARSALSEMSPSKVNIRAQEKPDIFSVAPFSSKLPTPSPAKQPGRQSAEEVLAMIATQDLDDDEFLVDKENADPFQSELKRESQKTAAVQSTSASSSNSIKHNSPAFQNLSKEIRAQQFSFDEDIFNDEDFNALDSGLEDGQDDYDNDLDDEALAALAAPSPSAQKLAIMSKHPQTIADSRIGIKGSTTSTKAEQQGRAAIGMPPPVQAASTMIEVDSPKLQRQLPPATQGNGFPFDGVQDDDLTSLVEKYDMARATSDQRVKGQLKPSRTIPWNHPPHSSLYQVSDELFTPDEGLHG